MGVRKVGPPKISSSRQVEEENPQGRADDRKYLVCRKAHKILRAGGARNVEKGRPHSGGVRQPSSRRKRQCGFINTKTPGFVVSLNVCGLGGGIKKAPRGMWEVSGMGG